MRELAAALKISPATVSLALRNDPRIASETRLKVQTFAEAQGYCLNPSVTALMSRVRASQPARYNETLGWLNTFSHPDYFTDPDLTTPEYLQRLWQGALERARQLGYGLDMLWMAAPRMTGRRMSEILAARGIRGILIPPLLRPNSHLSLDWSALAVTALSYTLARPQFHRVVPDHHHNMQTVLRQLKRQGLRKIGMLAMPRYDERSQNRLLAPFCFYQQTISPHRRVPVLPVGSPREASVRGWLQTYRPDAVIILAGSSPRSLWEIDIGDTAYIQSIHVVKMDCGIGDAEFPGIDENPLQIGAAAVDSLARQLHQNERGIPAQPHTLLVKGTWREGRVAVEQAA